MNKKWLPWAIVGGIVLLLLMMIGGTYNGLVGSRESVNTAFGNVQTQYQRRSELIPNLVNVVKGSANFEQETLNNVVNARAKATSMNIDISTATPQQLQDYQNAQGELSTALGRLIAISENYPELKTTQAFQDLMTQLEGTENRVQVARSDYNNVLRGYNTQVQQFPTAIVAGLFGFRAMPYFQASAGSETAPSVNFDTNTSTDQTQQAQ